MFSISGGMVPNELAACRLGCVCSDELLLTSEITSVSQHLDWQLPAVSRLLSTTGPPLPKSLSKMIPIFTRKEEMGVIASAMIECLCAPTRQRCDRLEERIQDLEFRAEHSGALGLCCAAPARSSQAHR